jgi:hypothetical protein
MVETLETLMTEIDDDDRNRCFWCLRKRHIKNECRAFKKAKAKSTSGRESTSTAESAKLAAASSKAPATEIESDISI